MKLSSINNLLLVLIVAVNTYVIAGPLLPKLEFWARNKGGAQGQAMQARAVNPMDRAALRQRPNSLLIPSMLLDQPVLEGPQQDMYKILDKGIWRWPAGSTPDKGSNTVLLGHRFTYTNPNGALYFLDKVTVGDTIGMIWDQKQYVYKVRQVKTVPPTAGEILAATSEPTLTIYTCTPLWKPDNRLVVTASLERTL